mgnify:CR=1
ALSAKFTICFVATADTINSGIFIHRKARTHNNINFRRQGIGGIGSPVVLENGNEVVIDNRPLGSDQGTVVKSQVFLNSHPLLESGQINRLNLW